MPRITYRDPMGQDASIELSDSFSEITIGRNPGNVICVNNPSLSRAHARIVFDQGVCTFYDLNSSNGSFINGKEVRSQPLKHGDRLRCGEFPLEYWVEAGSQPNASRLPPEANYEPSPTPMPQEPLRPSGPLSSAPRSGPTSMSSSAQVSSSALSGPTAMAGSGHSASNLSKPPPSASHARSARPNTAPPIQDPGRTWQPDQDEELERLRRQIKERDQDLERARSEHERLSKQARELQQKLASAQQAPQDPLGDILKSLHQINAQLGEVCQKMEVYIRDQE